MAYDGVGRRVGVCCASAEASPRSLLHRPHDGTNPIAEEEGGDDDKLEQAHNDRSSRGRKTLSLVYSVPFLII